MMERGNAVRITGIRLTGQQHQIQIVDALREGIIQ